MTSPHAGTAALDADLARAVSRTAFMRQAFYVVVLLVALAGQVSGAVETLHIPLLAAIPAVGALELGGVVVLANADVRRRLGERANASRILSAAIAAGAVAFNWLAHSDHLLGGFFAGMSALGYLVWLMHTENQRRDRLRATGQLAHVVPAYELVGHWLAHPWRTRRARSLAKADPQLGLYDSLAAARAAVRRERREAAIASVLHRKIRAAVRDKDTADIAVHVYDLAEIAARLADTADYAGLTALVGADLVPARLTAGTPKPDAEPQPAAPGEELTIAQLGVPVEPADPGAKPAALPQVMRPPTVANPLADRPISAPPADSRRQAPKVAEQVRRAAAVLARHEVELTPAEVAEIVGTDNVRHVKRVLGRAAQPATSEDVPDEEKEAVPA